ncbi:ferredoxin--NADP reductase [Actinocrispum wychmicini]|uniref:3-ketosteroid 9alpha-monooxygenase subunit B n=1 Tax=Actinocrispum wychmicini TaxID=1213861 RepID=A0A4R2INL4_9PSEU|nr:ferredoxin--NADP reductase [Actinocrispum wychmicini]TCO46743.1 3-ketosteroid 9alpha-monooxygenase subunit B [Actinocrispum wychmicini]
MAEYQQVKVADVIQETADAVSVVFDADFPYRPGQFLTLRCGDVARCYSLSSAPGLDRPQVTVKRIPDGYGSAWVCDNVRPGTVLDVLPPAGIFTPKSLDDNLLLFAAGSGITPVMSIVKSALAHGTGKLVLVYANRDESSVIFAARLRELASRYPERLLVVHWLESLQGLPTARHFAALRPFMGYQSFLCGPAPFMDVVSQALRSSGVPRERIHVERFISLSGNPFEEVVDEEPADGSEATVQVDLDGESHTFPWPRHKKLLDLLLEKGLAAPYSCREGACSACACRIERGEVKMLQNEILDQEDLDDGIVLACQSLPVTDTVRITYT